MIIDAHAHIFPSKIAAKASKAIGDFYNLPMRAEGTAEGLLAQGAGVISRYIVHSSATAVRQVRPINEFIFEEMQAHPEFIGFMTLHPDMSEQEVDAEMAWCENNGFSGIKLHPDFQKFLIDEERALKIYEAASGKFPILIHTGDMRFEYSRPERLAKIAKAFPELKLIGAHFGGYSRWNEVNCYKGIRNIYMDTSSSLAFMHEGEAERFINYFGAEWFFFGSDYPMWDIGEELERFMALKLTDEQREMILFKNIKSLLNL
ncbi:MAG: amidohydrolase family protein [Christensenellales bacterium]|jgi:predicted TIM-barrel fold metal-dependent hydrolase|nr:amidohydrolase family protein [Clostridia bacterium]HRU84606.1 amidohydrolase family protein [Eubacteriales bacterium]